MWRCTVCGYLYDEAKEVTPFEKLPDDWVCPICNASKDGFEKIT
jgi:rubredoxin